MHIFVTVKKCIDVTGAGVTGLLSSNGERAGQARASVSTNGEWRDCAEVSLSTNGEEAGLVEASLSSIGVWMDSAETSSRDLGSALSNS